MSKPYWLSKLNCLGACAGFPGWETCRAQTPQFLGFNLCNCDYPLICGSPTQGLGFDYTRCIAVPIHLDMVLSLFLSFFFFFNLLHKSAQVIFFLYFCFVFWPCCVARGILAPQPGIEPELPELEMQSLNHWTAREVPCGSFYPFNYRKPFLLVFRLFLVIVTL